MRPRTGCALAVSTAIAISAFGGSGRLKLVVEAHVVVPAANAGAEIPWGKSI